MDNEYAVQVEDLVKVYGEGQTAETALEGVDLGVKKGELVAVMGPSGSGKSTLLLVMGLVIDPTEGRLVLDREEIYNGKDGKRRDLQKLRREKVGFIFQFSNLIPFLDAKENVMHSLDIIGVTGQEAESRTMELFDDLGIADRADHMPDQLSGGEKQRVAVARALANNPNVILADEPTASLDTDRALRVMDLLRRLADEQDTAIIVVTHDRRMIDEVDKLFHLTDGHLTEAEEDQPGVSA
jgi:putative ABC transport system ATP-binding protein